MFAIFHHQLLKLPMSVKDKVPLRGLSCFPQQPDLNSTNGIITLHCARCFGFFWLFCFDLWGPGFILIILKCMLLFSCRFLLEHSQSLFSQDVNDFSQNNDTTVLTGTSGTHLLNAWTCGCDHLWYQTLWDWVVQLWCVWVQWEVLSERNATSVHTIIFWILDIMWRRKSSDKEEQQHLHPDEPKNRSRWWMLLCSPAQPRARLLLAPL